ncbi:MAG TPA: hypothetical protein VJO16_07400 [Candidatus Acidoferrum sp.]|nr:hypothetical protein [Candidatus Acidoferrum sp.]
MDNQQSPVTERTVSSRRLVLFAMLAIAAILTTLTSEYPASGSWQLPGICLAMYAIALFLLLGIPTPGVGGGFAIAVSALLGAASGVLACQLWALSQGEVSTAWDRQTIWTGAAASIANLGLLIAALRYILAAKQQLRWWHVVLGAAVAVPAAWILMSRIT